MTIYYIILFLICAFIVIPTSKKVDSVLFCILFSFSFIFFAGFRPQEASTDYVVYVELFNDLNTDITLQNLLGFAEPTFVLIGSLIKSLGLPVVWLFIIYAIIGISFKTAAILKYSEFIIPSLLVYYSNFFLLHEMTQIRVGVASGIFLLAVQYIYQKEKWKYFGCIGLAILFHYSAVVYLPIYFLNANEINKKKYYSIIIISIVIGFLKIPFIDYLKYVPIETIQKKQELYSGVLEMGIMSTNINLFNVAVLIDIFICLIFLYNCDFIAKKNRYFILFLKIYIVGLCSFYILASFPPIAFRIKELFIVSQFISIPFLFYLFPTRKSISISILILICLLFLYINTYNTHLVRDYDFFKIIYNSCNL
ncbi:EpsG family protein [Sphingobacterium faecium]|uniref:EpsG family protein n=1 Tax=Sphingobacterium faecium TaxID=34087 RepID=UPI003208D14F